jgi:hypothetical protein
VSADLVVELACDPLALGFLRHERFARALPPFVLKPIEHLVEGLGQGGNLLTGALRLEPLTRSQWFDRTHYRRQPLKGRERPPQQDQVSREDHSESRNHPDRLPRGYGVGNGHRPEDQQRGGHRQGQRGGDEQAPEQRTRPAALEQPEGLDLHRRILR